MRILIKNLVGKLKLKRSKPAYPLQSHEYRVFSQHREDGIIEHLLNEVGVSGNRFVEFGFGPDQCNCLNLAINRGFDGLLIDGSKNKCEQAKNAYRWLSKHSITVANAFLTKENINGVIKENGFIGEIDVLSIDIDGNDYWLWSEIEVISPRIVVVEYNASLGAEKTITVPYDPEFIRYKKHPSGFYYGASLAALEFLGHKKGYRLAGCDYSGVNAFFVRNDLANNRVSACTLANAFMENRGRVKYKNITTKMQFETIKEMPFVDVSKSD